MDQTPAPQPPKSSCAPAILDRIWDLNFKRAVPTPNYPPISSIPQTSPARLQRATPKECPDKHILSSTPEANDYLYDHTASTPTVLYLAYGSNLCAQTFLGQRGIRPISAVNVSAPSLSLTFDLPGIAYQEPCFANTAPRKLPKVPKPPTLPPGLDPPNYPFPPLSSASQPPGRKNGHGDPVWDGGLIGVVYEVTPEDYATIIKTEGGGTSYRDILCPCIPIPKKVGVPEKPPFPDLPRPFLAHTLYAPRIPTKPGDGDGPGGDDDDDGDEKSPLDKLKDRWREMLLQPVRPDPEYAQPSARYLQLIIDGAAEHGLPDAYQAWLARLQPYTITTRRQAIGQCLVVGLVLPLVGLFLALSKWLADDRGKIPAWLALALETVLHLVWIAYDRVFKPIFGDDL
ncbi:hypothetical protein VP1G_05114 [Cytospora mali]|uniref:gamma-glutamylcyclotransferase n=1 Tax=Cytospora mali TaxID=578113 RepID=A0A194V1M9_CYTMA|nr:hypothetical protein VP1G_05114 [Valsa mali var. pyri (nom. inval.)]